MWSIEALNDAASRWVELAWTVVWQSTILAAIVALIVVAFRRSSPEVRYWLWQIVAIKLLLMPFWTVAVPVWTESDERPAAPAGIQQGDSVVSDVWLEDAEAEHGTIDWADKSPAELQGRPAVQGRSRLGGSVALPNTTTSIDPTERPHVAEPAPSRRETRAVPSSSHPASAPAQIRWQAWLVLVWVSVVAAQAAGMLVQRIRLGRLMSTARSADPRLAALVSETAAESGLSRVPRTVLIDRNGSPFVCRVLRPVIAVPAAIREALTEGQLRQVLLHELAHIKRRDVLWGWIPEIARVLYFFHPVSHWVRFRIRLERELACDRIAMDASGAGAGEYAETLVRAVSFGSRPVMLQTGAVHCGCSSQLSPFWKRRIAMLPSTHRCRVPRFRSWLSLVAVGIMIAAVPTLLAVSATAQQPDAPSTLKPEAPKSSETPTTGESTPGTGPPTSSQERVEDQLEIGKAQPDRRARTWEKLAAERRKAQPEESPRETQSPPVLQAYGALPLSADGAFSDLIALANGYLEAIGNRDVGRIELLRKQDLLKKGAVSKHEVAVLEAELKHAVVQTKMLRRIAQAALKAANLEIENLQAELEFLQAQLRAQGQQGTQQLFAAQSRLRQAQARREILSAILEISVPDQSERDAVPVKR